MRVALTCSAIVHSHLRSEALMPKLSAVLTAVFLVLSFGSAVAEDQPPTAEPVAADAGSDSSQPAAAESTDAAPTESADVASPQSTDDTTPDSDSNK